MIIKGFEECKSTAIYILEESIPTTTLRFAVGDAVECRASVDGFTAGEIVHTFHKEPQFPPGHVVPYQIRLMEGPNKGGCVYVPADVDHFVRAAGRKGAAPKMAEMEAGVGAVALN